MGWMTSRFELSRGGEAHNVRPMEGLRGFAVFLVFIVHYVTLSNPWIVGHTSLLRLADALHAIGNTGVDLFFVLSGYLIYGSLIARPTSYRRFMWRRVVRIYPAFIVVFLLYLALSFSYPAESKIPPGVPGAATYLLQNFLLLPGLFPITPIITVAWSLSYELFYYLAIPVVIGAFGLRSRGETWRIVFFTTLAVSIFVLSGIYGGPVRLAMFVSGILLYEMAHRGSVASPGNGVAVITLAAGITGMLWIPLSGSVGIASKTALLFIAYFSLCFACFCNVGTWLPGLYSWTPMRWLGNMSYSYYLLHGLALKAAFMIFAIVLPSGVDGALLFWVMMPVAFGLTLIPTAILFLTIERPLSLSAPRKDRPVRQQSITTGTSEANAT